MADQQTEIVDGLIIDDVATAQFKVNRRVFTDPAIMELEKKRVFDKSWLYVGHESEIPDPGCFIKRRVGGRPVIFLRSKDGQVRALFDTCTHRGNSVCRGTRGQTDRFTCFYHGWAFNTFGELTTVPDMRGYGNKLDRKSLALASPPRLESYRGLVFMSMDPNIISLTDYLGGMAEYIDLVLDSSDSDSVVAQGQQSYSMKANWKLLTENSADGYHGPYTHQRFFTQHVRELGGDPQQWLAMAQQKAENRLITFDNGHSVLETPAGPLPLFVENPNEMAEVRRKLTERHGAERAHRLLDFSRNLVIFPNLVIIGVWRTIRTFYPAATDLLECEAWSLVGKDDSPELREARFKNFACFLGPAGFGTPDDVEGLEGCQKGFAVTEVPWTDLSKGMAREGGAISFDEIQMRNMWRKWYGLMNPDYVPQKELSAALLAQAAE